MAEDDAAGADRIKALADQAEIGDIGRLGDGFPLPGLAAIDSLLDNAGGSGCIRCFGIYHGHRGILHALVEGDRVPGIAAIVAIGPHAEIPNDHAERAVEGDDPPGLAIEGLPLLPGGAEITGEVQLSPTEEADGGAGPGV